MVSKGVRWSASLALSLLGFTVETVAEEFLSQRLEIFSFRVLSVKWSTVEDCIAKLWRPL